MSAKDGRQCKTRGYTRVGKRAHSKPAAKFPGKNSLARRKRKGEVS